MKITYLYIILVLAGALTIQSVAIANLRKGQNYLGSSAQDSQKCSDLKNGIKKAVQAGESEELAQGMEKIVTEQVVEALINAVAENQASVSEDSSNDQSSAQCLTPSEIADLVSGGM